MNHFGKLFTVNVFGESHGESVGIVIDGCPAGMPLAVEDFIKDTERRKGGSQRGTTPRQEENHRCATYHFIRKQEYPFR
jgi:chorismate synthase